MLCFELVYPEVGPIYPTPVECSATPETSTQLVMMTQTEYVQLSNNPFNLTVADGQALVTAMLFPITIAFVYRLIIRAMREFTKENSIEE